MADRVPPSRDSQSQTWWENVADNLDETGRSEAADVIRAWWSGRLVDREDIERRIRKAMTLEVDEWADAIVNAVLFEGEAHREAG